MGRSDSGTRTATVLTHRRVSDTAGFTQGTGLGLAISYGLIQEHGGRIFVESRVGEGTHFTIKLPSVSYSRQMQAASD